MYFSLRFRSGCLQAGDRVTLLNDNSLLCLSEPKQLEHLICSKSATLTVEFPVAQTVVPSSGVFTVKLANNRTCGLGITVTGLSVKSIFSINFYMTFI